ncbi:MAG TPA: hypothetical protein DIW53_16740 [Achromobacter sp.]|nr:hypothetical protein [Achromobacter sp.]
MHDAWLAVGADMSISVSGKDVCGFCKGDIAAAAQAAGLNSLSVRAVDNKTGLPKTYYWTQGMRSIREKNRETSRILRKFGYCAHAAASPE